VKPIRHKTGWQVPYSGIYRVYHKEHRLPHQVTLLKENSFPACAKCKEAVHFELVMGIAEPSTKFGFRVTLNELPEVEGIATPKKKERVS
jgi:hypothetical protein